MCALLKFNALWKEKFGEARGGGEGEEEEEGEGSGSSEEWEEESEEEGEGGRRNSVEETARIGKIFFFYFFCVRK